MKIELKHRDQLVNENQRSQIHIIYLNSDYFDNITNNTSIKAIVNDKSLNLLPRFDLIADCKEYIDRGNRYLPVINHVQGTELLSN